MVLPMFVAEKTVLPRKHYEDVVKGVKNLTPLYLPEAKKEANITDVDVRQYF